MILKILWILGGIIYFIDLHGYLNILLYIIQLKQYHNLAND